MSIIRKIIILSIIYSFALCEIAGYSTVYIMEFENISYDYSINSFKNAFPDLIIENYSFREDIVVEYAENIDPYNKQIDFSQKALIINGRFKTDEERIDVEIDIYDLRNWDLLNKKSFYCSKKDFVCIHDAFLITIEELVNPFLLEEVISEDFIYKSTPKNQSIIIEVTEDKARELEKEYVQNLESDAVQAEFDVLLNQNDNQNEYFREFNFTSSTESSIPLIDSNTERFVHILSQFLSNPYNVEIGNMDVKLNEDNIDLIDVTVPVNFSIKQSLIDEMLSKIPKQTIKNKDDLLMLQFSNKDFRFNRELIEQLAHMRYQLIPTINFVNKMGELQLLILDSWKKKYNELIIGGTGVIQKNNFTSLYTIKPGQDNIQISIDLNDKQIVYSFSVRYNTFGDYTKMIVKFMLERDLDQYLSVSSRN